MSLYFVKTLFKLKPVHTRISAYFSQQQKNVKEVKIPVPAGHLAAKVWGDDSLPLVVCGHGFMDSASSFDLLIPKLPDNYCYVAVDMPGHGKSSHIQKGFMYTDNVYSHTYEIVRRHFGVNEIGIIGHSMCGAYGIRYPYAYKDRTKFLVVLDFLGFPDNPLQPRLMHFSRRIDKLIGIDAKPGKEGAYSKAILLDGMVKAYKGSINRKMAEVLIDRSVTETEDGLYKLTRDVKVQNNQIVGVPSKINLPYSPDMKVCLLEALSGLRFNGNALRKWYLDQYLKKCGYVEYHKVKGTHHFHLEYPDNVGNIVRNFIEKV